MNYKASMLNRKRILIILKKITSQEYWDKYEEALKKLNKGNYPEWWYRDVITSGLYAKCREEWNKRNNELRIY